MSNYGTEVLSWKENKMMFKGKMVMSVVPHEAHKNMFRVRWQDKVLSADFYNLTWAREHALNEALMIIRKGTEEETQDTWITVTEASLMR